MNYWSRVLLVSLFILLLGIREYSLPYAITWSFGNCYIVCILLSIFSLLRWHWSSWVGRKVVISNAITWIICNVCWMRRVVFLSQGVFRYENVDSATHARDALQGADIYSGCCTLRVEYAKVSRYWRLIPTVLILSLYRSINSVVKSINDSIVTVLLNSPTLETLPGTMVGCCFFIKTPLPSFATVMKVIAFQLSKAETNKLILLPHVIREFASQTHSFGIIAVPYLRLNYVQHKS